MLSVAIYERLRKGPNMKVDVALKSPALPNAVRKWRHAWRSAIRKIVQEALSYM